MPVPDAGSGGPDGGPDAGPDAGTDAGPDGPTCGSAGDAGSVEAGCAAGADAGSGNIDEGDGSGSGASSFQTCEVGDPAVKTAPLVTEQKPSSPIRISATTGSCSYVTSTWGIIMFPDVVCGAKCRDLNMTFDPPAGAVSGPCQRTLDASNACLLDETKKCSDRGGAFMITSGPSKCYGTGWVNGANLAIIGRRCNGNVNVDATWSCTR